MKLFNHSFSALIVALFIKSSSLIFVSGSFNSHHCKILFISSHQ
ncbi:MAG TPA: hypothetical protein PKY44_05520 [Bacteroidales bacterium]|nr:hypothetical protein [Bacteroidales bacterium]